MFIPRTASIEGFVDFAGAIVVEGTVSGEVRCTTLTIKERGQVDGNVVADRVTVLSDVTGAIYANDLICAPRAHLRRHFHNSCCSRRLLLKAARAARRPMSLVTNARLEASGKVGTGFRQENK
jgi:hypothetical protein